MCSRKLALTRLEQAICVFREHGFAAAEALATPGTDDGVAIARILAAALSPPSEYPAAKLTADVAAAREDGPPSQITENAACLAREHGDIVGHLFWLKVAHWASSYEDEFDDEQEFPQLLGPTPPEEILAAALFETGEIEQAVTLGINHTDEVIRVYWGEVRTKLQPADGCET